MWHGDEQLRLGQLRLGEVRARHVEERDTHVFSGSWFEVLGDADDTANGIAVEERVVVDGNVATVRQRDAGDGDDRPIGRLLVEGHRRLVGVGVIAGNRFGRSRSLGWGFARGRCLRFGRRFGINRSAGQGPDGQSLNSHRLEAQGAAVEHRSDYGGVHHGAVDRYAIGGNAGERYRVDFGGHGGGAVLDVDGRRLDGPDVRGVDFEAVVGLVDCFDDDTL